MKSEYLTIGVPEKGDTVAIAVTQEGHTTIASITQDTLHLNDDLYNFLQSALTMAGFSPESVRQFLESD